MSLSTFAAMFTGYIRLLLLCICLHSFGSAPAQSLPAPRHPAAILVQLKAERNRINALLAQKNYADLEQFKADAQEVMMATVRDFRDHFSYCRVYYYIDTNFDEVMARKFDGVLLDDHLTPVGNINLGDSSSDYMIVFYGYPTWQTGKRKWDTTKQKDWGGAPAGRGLVINDPDFKQIYYINNVDMDFFNFRRKNNKNPYQFLSRKFNIDYTPTAAEFNRKLLYRKHR